MFPAGTVAPEPVPPVQPAIARAEVGSTCQKCGRGPAGSVRLFEVRSYVVVFRWFVSRPFLCRSCAMNAMRDAQYRNLTRGWWGLLLGPVANVVALARNAVAWRRIRRMPAAEGEQWLLSNRPVSRRPLAYVATALVAGIVALAIGQPSAGAPATAVADDASASTPLPVDPSDEATPAPPLWTGPLAALALPVPRGYRHEPDLTLDAAALSKSFKNPTAVQTDLTALHYQRGFDREIYTQSPRADVIEELWQFDTVDDTDGWLTVWQGSNTPQVGSTYKTAFHVDTMVEANGYLARKRDRYGFSYGIGIARVDNVIVHIRYGSLSPVTQHDISVWLDRAVRTAKSRTTG